MKSDPKLPSNRVYLSGFCKEEYTQSQLETILRLQIEGIEKLTLPKRTYKGYAFIDLKDQSFTKKILNKGKILVKETWLKISPYRNSDEIKEEKISLLNRKIFVHNIPETMSDQEFRALFINFGEIEEAYICQRGKNKKFRRGKKKIGYVVYKDEMIARNLIELGNLNFDESKLFICEVKGKKFMINKLSKEKKVIKVYKQNLKDVVKFHYFKPTRSKYWDMREEKNLFRNQEGVNKYRLNKKWTAT